MHDVLLFAGTTEGRRIAEACRGKDLFLTVSTATEYGSELIEPAENIRVLHGRKDTDGVVRLILETGADFLIDATHPYAEIVSETLREAAERTGTEYVRVRRDEDHRDTDECVFVNSSEEAVSFLNGSEGGALLTVGSKELSRYTAVSRFAERLYVRILPTKESADLAFELGFRGAHLICMQGPFSEELNLAMLRTLPVRYLVTKDTGKEGGFTEKIAAAKACGVTPVVIRRPEEETGISVSECVKLLGSRFGFEPSRDKAVAIVGIGTGNLLTMTEEVRSTLERAERIIGAKRVTDAISSFHKPVINAVSAKEIESLVRNAPEQRIVVAMSGDTGFFSGTKGLLERLKDLDPLVLPGVSSVPYLAAKMGVPWSGAALVSAHGRALNLLSKVRKHARTFVLAGGEDGVRELLSELTEYGFGRLSVTVGSDLSYENETVVSGTAESLMEHSFPSLSVFCIENPDAKRTVVTHGRADGDFIRGNVPMTKSEVRAVTLSRLRLTADAVCWDVGAGTGSVSIEMAECCEDGFVYAVEQNAEACELIEQNKRHLGVSNVAVVLGSAPEALSALPAPTHVFIGGSGGNLSEILSVALKKNPNVRIVLNTVTTETFAEAVSAAKSLPLTDPDITQILVSKADRVGGYHLMRAQNPVTIISMEGRDADA